MANFFIYKYLQIAPLLIIFVDILPKVSAVHSAEVFNSNNVVVVLLIISQSVKLVMSSYQLQGHECRSVQYTSCVKVEVLYASCELHRHAFMTLEPIR